MSLGISLDVGQENLATIQGAGGEVEAGVELGGGAVIFFEDFGGCGFFVVDPLELFFQDLLVFVFGNVIFQEFPELVQAGVGGGVHLISKFVHFLLSAGCLELEVEIVVGGFAGVVESFGFFCGSSAVVRVDTESFCLVDDDGDGEFCVIVVGHGYPTVYFSRQIAYRGAGKIDFEGVGAGQALGFGVNVFYTVDDFSFSDGILISDVRESHLIGGVIHFGQISKMTGKIAVVKSAVAIAVSRIAHIGIVVVSGERAILFNRKISGPGAGTARSEENSKV